MRLAQPDGRPRRPWTGLASAAKNAAGQAEKNKQQTAHLHEAGGRLPVGLVANPPAGGAVHVRNTAADRVQQAPRLWQGRTADAVGCSSVLGVLIAQCKWLLCVDC